jgi:hypothetical protein
MNKLTACLRARLSNRYRAARFSNAVSSALDECGQNDDKQDSGDDADERNVVHVLLLSLSARLPAGVIT